MSANKKKSGTAAIVYRIVFAVLLAGCLFNAYDAYTESVRLTYGLHSGGSASFAKNEAWAFLGLSFILTFEMVGLMMYNRVVKFFRIVI